MYKTVYKYGNKYVIWGGLGGDHGGSEGIGKGIGIGSGSEGIGIGSGLFMFFKFCH